MTKQFTPDLKIKAVNYYHKINNYVKVCEVFECSERSLKRWVERFRYYLIISVVLFIIRIIIIFIYIII